MKRIFSLIILLAITPGVAYALGLGNLELNSALNEPFSGKIKLLSASADELDALNVSLADSEAFARANIERPFVLSNLNFKLVRAETGDDYIKVSSQDAIREPFLNFLVEVNWSNGRLFREYTVLLDPPMYDPNVKSSTAQIMALQPAVAPSNAAPVFKEDNQVVYADDFDKFANDSDSPVAATNPVAPGSYAGGDFGPTAASDTLWSIASAMRPDASVSVNQMMLALLNANPDAFLNNNINGLKRGQILKMPADSEVQTLSQADALSEVKSQYAAWEQIKGKLGTSISERAESSSSAVAAIETDTLETPVTAEDAELKLLAASEKPESTQQVANVDAGSANDLVFAQENIQALTQENLELKDQLQETESLLNDLKRLLELKDDELAALQEQMMQEVEAPVDASAEEPIDEVVEVIEEAVSDNAITEEAVTEAEEEQPTEEVTEAIEEELAEVEVIEEVEEPVAAEEPEIIDVIETEPETESAGIMDMVQTYLGPIVDLTGGNPLYAIAALGLLVVLILIAVAAKLKKKSSAEGNSDALASADEFPEFDTGDADLDEAEQELESEAETILPGSDDETFAAKEEDDSEDETYLPGGDDQAVESAKEEVSFAAEEEEEDEDPLQEVNTYLAFEQFDQAEEFVRNAITGKPDNAEYHTKLLEVFYTSGNKKSYEEEAKVLHDLVNGDGEHWDMAVAMWSEMSPNRALFEEGVDDDDDSSSDASGGFVDVTADAEANDDNSLDFDIGAGGDEESTVAESDDELLDITAADDGEDILDVTAAVGLEDEADESEDDDDVLDISGSSAGEDLLDVTAVGTDDEDGLDEDVLDVSGSSAGEDLLESTSAEDSGEDLLDVTSSSELDADENEDLLDVTAATGAGADSDELLDLDIGDADADSENDSDEGDNVIDFDLASSSDDGDELSLDMEDDADTDSDSGLELDLSSTEETDDDDNGLELDLSDSGLDSDTVADEPIRLDVEDDGEEDSSDMDFSFDLDDSNLQEDAESSSDKEGDDAPAMDFDLSIDEGTDEPDSGLDDGTLELEPPKLELDDDEDDDDENTVFVPRASQPDEQSIEDEIATKLDLAKAYVELGDKDSAKTILDEVLTDGNEEQKQQAQDLMGQL